jgi:arylsulfatase A-like enzyme
MCAYTGRYMRTHGSTQNGVPLKVGELTLGDRLGKLGVRTVLVGKTHMVADDEGLARLGIDKSSVIGVHVSECGFEPYERDDGLHPDGPYSPDPAYDRYLREQGFPADNPWEYWANSAEGPDGATQNGWLLAHADKVARVPDEHSETPYMTRRAMAFMREAKADGRPWCLHLSYIKPHWPYIVPAPYHNMYGPADVVPRSAPTRSGRAHIRSMPPSRTSTTRRPSAGTRSAIG